jgi:AcrR family transcriptional regulator
MTKGSDTKQNIVDKSEHLFSIKGYYSTSVADIMEATGLTKGGLYGHFKSKEDIWYAVYDQASAKWSRILFEGVKLIDDPLERIEKVLSNFLNNYLGDNAFAGGCFFLNMLVELSGQSGSMSTHVLNGYINFSKLLNRWLKEAKEKNILKPGLNFPEIASFVVISMNGCAALYSATRDPEIWGLTLTQLKFYFKQLRR